MCSCNFFQYCWTNLEHSKWPASAACQSSICHMGYGVADSHVDILCDFIHSADDRNGDFLAHMPVPGKPACTMGGRATLDVVNHHICGRLDRTILRTQYRRQETLIFERCTIPNDRPSLVDAFYIQENRASLLGVAYLWYMVKTSPFIIAFPTHQAKGGLLSFGEYDEQIPFPIERIYWSYDMLAS